MTPLRAQMIKAMQMHGFSERTHQSYLAAVAAVARHYQRAPDSLSIKELDRYFEHLVIERKLAPASIRLALNGLRFFYVEVLKWETLPLTVALPKRAQRIPELLTRAEVARILAACTHPRYRMMLLRPTQRKPGVHFAQAY